MADISNISPETSQSEKYVSPIPEKTIEKPVNIAIGKEKIKEKIIKETKLELIESAGKEPKKIIKPESRSQNLPLSEKMTNKISSEEAQQIVNTGSLQAVENIVGSDILEGKIEL